MVIPSFLRVFGRSPEGALVPCSCLTAVALGALLSLGCSKTDSGATSPEAGPTASTKSKLASAAAPTTTTPPPATTTASAASTGSAPTVIAPPTEPGDTSSKNFEGTDAVVEQKRPEQPPSVLRDVRFSQQPLFDRVVFEFEGQKVPGYRLEYHDKAPQQCGTNKAMEVQGTRWLELRLTPSLAHTRLGSTVQSQEMLPSLTTLKEIAQSCDSQNTVSWVLGVASMQKFRVLELQSPPRLVIDLKH